MIMAGGNAGYTRKGRVAQLRRARRPSVLQADGGQMLMGENNSDWAGSEVVEREVGLAWGVMTDLTRVDG